MGRFRDSLDKTVIWLNGWAIFSIRGLLSGLLRYLTLFFYLVCPLRRYIVQGVTESGDRLSVLFIGLDKKVFHYLSESIFARGYSQRRLRNVYYFRNQISNIFNCESDAVFIEINILLCGYFRNRGYSVFPKKLFGVLDLERDINEKMSDKALKSDIRLIKKFSYTYKISNSLDELILFYNSMYIPYMKNRHGPRAIIRSLDFLKWGFRKGFILFIEKENILLSGVLIVNKNKMKDICEYWAIGVRGGDFSYVRNGVISALHYYSVLELRNRGYKKINFGFVRPFFRNGLFYYKQKWTTEFIEDPLSMFKIAFKVSPLGKYALDLNRDYL